MTDLIWIGNTLYPRWFVIAAAIAILTASAAAALIVYLESRS